MKKVILFSLLIMSFVVLYSSQGKAKSRSLLLNYTESPISYILHYDKDFTIIARFTEDSFTTWNRVISSAGAYPTFITDRGISGDRGFFSFYDTTNAPIYTYYSFEPYNDTTTAKNMEVAVVKTGSDVYFYVNGDSIRAVQNYVKGYKDTLVELYLGAGNSRVYSVYIYDRALDHAEIKYIYNHHKPMSYDSLKVYYDFQHFSQDADTIYDMSGNNNNAVVLDSMKVICGTGVKQGAK